MYRRSRSLFAFLFTFLSAIACERAPEVERKKTEEFLKVGIYLGEDQIQQLERIGIDGSALRQDNNAQLMLSRIITQIDEKQAYSDNLAIVLSTGQAIYVIDCIPYDSLDARVDVVQFLEQGIPEPSRYYNNILKNPNYTVEDTVLRAVGQYFLDQMFQWRLVPADDSSLNKI